MRLNHILTTFVLASVAVAQSSRTLSAPVDISETYEPSGYMGDGEAGAKFVQMRRVSGELARPGGRDGLCMKVTYQPGSKKWAGVFWQYPPDNWGDKPGINIQGATKITFWAVGTKGGEIVEFKAGGITGKRYQDSFERSIGSVALTNNWRQYSIPLSGQNLSSVVGAFAWIATAADNPHGLSFYLDGIRYE